MHKRNSYSIIPCTNTVYLQVPDATVRVEACTVTVMVVVTIEMLGDVTTNG